MVEDELRLGSAGSVRSVSSSAGSQRTDPSPALIVPGTSLFAAKHFNTEFFRITTQPFSVCILFTVVSDDFTFVSDVHYFK